MSKPININNIHNTPTTPFVKLVKYGTLKKDSGYGDLTVIYTFFLMTLSIKTIASVLKVSTYIITVRHIGFATIVILSVLTCTTAVILYI